MDDFLVEGNEAVILTLTPGGYTIGASNTATVTIADTKGYRLLDMDSPSNAPVPVRASSLQVTLSRPGGDIVATASTDASGRLQIDAGAEAAQVTAVAVQDSFGNSGSAGF